MSDGRQYSLKQPAWARIRTRRGHSREQVLVSGQGSPHSVKISDSTTISLANTRIHVDNFGLTRTVLDANEIQPAGGQSWPVYCLTHAHSDHLGPLELAVRRACSSKVALRDHLVPERAYFTLAGEALDARREGAIDSNLDPQKPAEPSPPHTVPHPRFGGYREVLLTTETTVALARARWGRQEPPLESVFRLVRIAAGQSVRFPGGNRVEVISTPKNPDHNRTTAQLDALSAGHVAGSLAFLVHQGAAQNDAGSVFVTGDFHCEDRQFLPGCPPQHCDTLVLDATFGSPDFDFPPFRALRPAILDFLEDALTHRSVACLGYGIGKAQLLVSLLAELPLDVPVVVPAATQHLTRSCVSTGYPVTSSHPCPTNPSNPETELQVIDLSGGASFNAPSGADECKEAGREWNLGIKEEWNLKWNPEGLPWGQREAQRAKVTKDAAHVLVVPPGSKAETVHKLQDRGYVVVDFSGWAVDPAYRDERDADAFFALSDHCGWTQLQGFVTQCKPHRVVITRESRPEILGWLRGEGYDVIWQGRAEISRSIAIH